MAGNRFGLVTAKTVRIDQAWNIERSTNDMIIKDLLNSNVIPFMIKAAAPTDSLIIATTGIGIGRTPTAGYRLDVGQATLAVLLESTTGTNRADLVVKNTGGTFSFAIDNSVGAAFGTAYIGAIVRSGAFPLAFFTNGVERLRIDSVGNLGVGISPTTKLHVSGAGTTSSFYTNGDAVGQTLYLQDTGGAPGNGGQILFGASFGAFAGIKSYLVNGTGPAGALVFQTRDSSGNIVERMQITSTGAVGIGIAPAAFFHVNGYSRLVGALDVKYHANVSAHNGMVLGTAAKAISPSGGQGSIQIVSNDLAAAQLQASFSLVTDPTATNRRLAIQCIEQGTSNRDITLAEAGGSVAIGFSSATVGSRLEVRGTGSSTIGTLHIVGSASPGSGNKWLTMRDWTNTATFFYIDDVSNMFITGNIGINWTSPPNKLNVMGLNVSATTLANSLTGAAVLIQPKSSSGYQLAIGTGPGDVPHIQVGTGSTPGNMALQPFGGSLGVGTAAPQATLHIHNTSADSQMILSDTGPSIKLTNNVVFASSNAALLIAMATIGGHYSLPVAGDCLISTWQANRGNLYISANYSGAGTKHIVMQTLGTGGSVGIAGIPVGNSVLEVFGKIGLKANPNVIPGLDFAESTSIPNYINIVSGGTYDLGSGGGILLIHGDADGLQGLYIFGGGTVIKVAGDAQFIVSLTPGGNQVGFAWTGAVYRIKNAWGTTRPFFLTYIRTRTGS